MNSVSCKVVFSWLSGLFTTRVIIKKSNNLNIQINNDKVPYGFGDKKIRLRSEVMYVQHRMSVEWKLTLISLLMTLGFSDAGVATVAETFADSQRHHHRNHHALTHKLKFQEPEVLLDSQLERAPSLPSPEEIEDASRRSIEGK